MLSFIEFIKPIKKYTGLLIAYVLIGAILLITDFCFAPTLVNIFSKYQGVEIPVLILTPYYLQITISLIIIYAGFFSERYREARRRRDEVDKILPLIEFELRCNYKYIISTTPINISNDEFYTDYWIIYKNDLRGWEHINIVPLTEIYGLMIKFSSKNELVFAERLKGLIKHQLEVYQKWYSDEGKEKAGKSARESKKVVIEQLKKLAEKHALSGVQFNVVFEMEKELVEINEKIK